MSLVGFGVGAEDRHKEAVLLQKLKGTGDLRFFVVALDVDEKYVLPGHLLGRAALDHRQVDVVGIEGGHGAHQRAGAVLDGEEDTGLVLARGLRLVLPDH